MSERREYFRVRALSKTEAELELPGTGLPTRPSVVRAVAAAAGEPRMALQFDDPHADDREHIAQLALRIQSQALRAERAGGAR